MALQAPVRLTATKSIPSNSSLTPSGNAGLCRPSDPFALKSSFFSPSLNLFPQSSIPLAAAKFSMRLASKPLLTYSKCLWVNCVMLWFDVAGTFTMTGLLYVWATETCSIRLNNISMVCGAPKRRFRTYEPAVTKNANATDARKARKADLQREATLGKALLLEL